MRPGVIVSGRAGGIPSFFDSAVGGTGAHPLAGMGSGFHRIKPNEPVLVDLVHAHRGYIVDMTRMFVAGTLSQQWHQRLEDMLAVKDIVVDVLDQGRTCEDAWNEAYALAVELGYEGHLMGMNPDQSRFLGHSVGLQLDESPVVAAGFDRPASNWRHHGNRTQSRVRGRSIGAKTLGFAIERYASSDCRWRMAVAYRVVMPCEKQIQ